jgi:hypothetical protein
MDKLGYEPRNARQTEAAPPSDQAGAEPARAEAPAGQHVKQRFGSRAGYASAYASKTTGRASVYASKAERRSESEFGRVSLRAANRARVRRVPRWHERARCPSTIRHAPDAPVRTAQCPPVHLVFDPPCRIMLFLKLKLANCARLSYSRTLYFFRLARALRLDCFPPAFSCYRSCSTQAAASCQH